MRQAPDEPPEASTIGWFVLALATFVVAYVRVSTAEQAERGASLEAQRDRCERYAALYELELVAVHSDEGASGKTLDRPGLAAALDDVRRGRATGLLVARLDRLTRSVQDLGALLAGALAPERAALLSVAEQVDTATAAGRLVVHVLGAVAQWEREAIAERTAAALEAKRARGELAGTAPYGWRVAADGVHVEADPDEQAALKRLIELRAAGESIRGIAEALEAEGHPARGARWHPTTVARLLRRRDG